MMLVNRDKGRFNRRDALVAMAIIGLTVCLYGPVRHFDFVHLDDSAYLSENPFTQQGLGWASARRAFSSVILSNYAPVTALSFAADYSLWGLRPGPVHVENVILHATSAAGWYLLWVALTGRRSRSFMVAALFSLHPMHVEPVAWISGRGDMLCMPLMIATLLAYVQFIRTGKRAYYGLSVIIFPLAILSKTIAMVLPGILLLLNVWPMRRLQFGAAHTAHSHNSVDDGEVFPPASKMRIVMELAPFALLGAAAAAIGLFGRLSTHASLALQQWSITDRAATVVFGYCKYVLKFVVPEPMVALYPLRHSDHLPPTIAAAGLLLLISLLVFQSRHRRPYLIVGWLWFLGTLLPTIGIFQSGNQGIADRYTYLPYVGLSVAIVWGLSDEAAKFASGVVDRRPWFVAIASLAALIACGIDSRRQLHYWRNSYVLFEHVQEYAPDNADVAAFMGNEYRYAGQTQKAFDAYARSVSLDPNNALAQSNLANMLLPMSPAYALPHFQLAATLTPDDPTGWWNLGVCQQQLHQDAAAAASFRRALQLSPGFQPAVNSLGKTGAVR